MSEEASGLKWKREKSGGQERELGISFCVWREATGGFPEMSEVNWFVFE